MEPWYAAVALDAAVADEHGCNMGHCRRYGRAAVPIDCAVSWGCNRLYIAAIECLQSFRASAISLNKCWPVLVLRALGALECARC